jgi:hypothetical protein
MEQTTLLVIIDGARRGVVAIHHGRSSVFDHAIFSV